MRLGLAKDLARTAPGRKGDEHSSRHHRRRGGPAFSLQTLPHARRESLARYRLDDFVGGSPWTTHWSTWRTTFGPGQARRSRSLHANELGWASQSVRGTQEARSPDPSDPVLLLVSDGLFCIELDATLHEVAEHLAATGVGALAVTDGDRVENYY